MGVQATGKDVTLSLMMLLQIADGKIVEKRSMSMCMRLCDNLGEENVYCVFFKIRSENDESVYHHQ